MNTTSLRRILPALAVAITALHIGMTALYLSPSSIVRRETQSLWAPYMSTLFHQNWHLFSPDPGLASTKLAVQCHWDDGASSDWIDPAEPVLSASYGGRRLLGYGKLMYIIREIPRGLQRDMVVAYNECRKQHGPADPADSANDECTLAILAADVSRHGAGAAARNFAIDVCLGVAHDRPLSAVDYKVIDFMPLKYSDRARFADEGIGWSQVIETAYPTITIVDEETPR